MKLRNNYRGSLLISTLFLLTTISGLFYLELGEVCNQRVRTQVKIKCHTELEVRWREEM